MRTLPLLSALVLATASLTSFAAPPDINELPGNYFLQGVREVGSELWLGKNGKFQFMLIYGSQDDGTEGVWEIKNELIVLTPVKNPMVFRLETDSEFKAKKEPGAGTWVAVASTADILLKNIEVKFEAASGKSAVANTNPRNGEATVTMPAGEVWARTGLRRSNSQEEWQWLAVTPERAKARIAGFRLTNPISAMTAFESLELKVGKDGLVVADEKSALADGVYKKAKAR
ncbi:hypothetical protein [Massilia pseudoviolaceinigra]|uniref:hypothetical protein n=1 Tax=Massilia pseudoviolaceinigra TaxID=3057165 RepID=UPI002796C3F9|nr:hypothetical protein [Massilia sp. CCM 9206]MDQ1923479.1 hypothetical protein [Massilia sp. CCM 9206]